MVGLVSFGIYIPKYWIKAQEIAKVWGVEENRITDSLGIKEKTVAGIDEDAVTLGYEAATAALVASNIKPEQIESLFVGSESHPYAVNPTSTTIGEFLGLGHHYFSADLEFACKAATTGLIVTTSLLASQKTSYGLVIGTDVAQAKPQDVLECAASSAAAAFILGREEKEVIAEIKDYLSFSSDTPDFWRRDGAIFPTHSGRFTGEPAYFTHVMGASLSILKRSQLKPSDFDYCVFHMPNNKFPKQAAKRLGFSIEQLEKSLTVEKLGNPYSASALIGLANVLNVAKPGQLIFFASYGSGAGSDVIIFKVTKNITAFQKKTIPLTEMLNKEKIYISYTQYLKMRKYI